MVPPNGHLAPGQAVAPADDTECSVNSLSNAKFGRPDRASRSGPPAFAGNLQALTFPDAITGNIVSDECGRISDIPYMINPDRERPASGRSTSGRSGRFTGTWSVTNLANAGHSLPMPVIRNQCVWNLRRPVDQNISWSMPRRPSPA
jgi:hypothetical protein